jgi:transposase
VKFDGEKMLWCPGQHPKLFSRLCHRAIGLQFRNQTHELLGDDHPLLSVIARLLSIHENVCQQQSKFDDEVRRLVKQDETTRRLMTVRGVGVVTALTLRHTIDDPSPACHWREKMVA